MSEYKITSFKTPCGFSHHSNESIPFGEAMEKDMEIKLNVKGLKAMSKYRLDYISKFKPGTVERMTELRAKFIELEREIQRLRNDVAFEDWINNNASQVGRTFDQAMTHLETAQMYAIKMLCLMGEDKNVER